MSRAHWTAAASLVTGLLITGCGGGGGSVPSQTTHPAAPPAAANRTSVGRANLTLVLPKVLVGKTGQVVRAAPNAAARSAKFVDPGASNVIDIYVDGTLIPNLDGTIGQSDSLGLVATPDGTQAVSLPLFQTNNNLVVAVEYDGAAHSNIVAIGETNLANFSIGTTTNLTITMLMNAKHIGIVDLPLESNPFLMDGLAHNIGILATCNGSNQYAAFPADSNGTFVPVSGYGGTSNPSVTGNGIGLTSLSQVQTQFVPSFTISWDPNCDDMLLGSTATNPAYAVWNDFFVTNSSNYNNAFYNGDFGGQYQGIWDLYFMYGALPNLGSIATPSITSTIDIY